ncbi:MAG: coenzyme F420-0:L-glutamate ligase [Nitrososphaerota archaeon]|nr:coenzyme F420-0:L-glutamate ligase [Candidatus Bathyarchaeota archaeon]MDW8048332.1 coenzyme F420-0:L-glutamate ligase [Nitrososphaerota archaeon]
MQEIKIIPILGLPIIQPGDDLGELICKAAEKQSTPIEDGDIIVVTHVVVSRAENNIINLDEIVPSDFAKRIAAEYGRDPAHVEVVLREAKSIIRMRDGHIIAETKHGFICANAGVDKSNVPGERNVTPLPEDPDRSARNIRRRIREITGKDVAVIISDTHGRALRRGEINVAVGISGMKPIRDRRGEFDLFGYMLRIKQTAVADELASAAELVIGQANEGIPAAIIRGYRYVRSEESSARELVWPREKALFY